MCGGMRAETASAVKSIISNSGGGIGNGNSGKDVQGWVHQSSPNIYLISTYLWNKFDSNNQK